MILNRNTPDIFKEINLMLRTAQPQMFAPIMGMQSSEVISLAIKLFEEEGIKEYLGALKEFLAQPTREKLIEVFDGGLDTIVVVAWFLETLKLPNNAGWNEVMRANMSKFPLVSEYPTPPKLMDLPEYKELDVEIVQVGERWVFRNAKTGKFLKPETYKEPNLGQILLEVETIQNLIERPDQISTHFIKDYFQTMEGNGQNVSDAKSR